MGKVIMTITLKPETAARIADLAQCFGFAGPDACKRALKVALDDLEARTLPPSHKMTLKELAAEKAYWAGVARRNRALHPFDDGNPPSKFWQDELCDEQGLPK